MQKTTFFQMNLPGVNDPAYIEAINANTRKVDSLLSEVPQSFSVETKGYFSTIEELQAAYPTGSDGDAYIVGTGENAAVYAWTPSGWANVGKVQGPTGADGAEGPQGPQGPAGPQGPQGPAGASGVLTVNGQAPDSSGNVNVQAGIRPNLLDNWYFGNPVNQRGQTEYDGVGAYPYAFDRWIARGSVLTLVDGGVEIGTGGAQVNNIALQTSIENTENLVGKKVTISFLISENNATNDTYVGIFYGASSVNMTLWALQSAAIPAGATGLFSATGVLPDMGTHKAMNPCLRVQGTQSGSLKVTAAKLELGEGQTLAHQDADGNWVLNEIPDYAEELAKCQRYQYVIRGYASAYGTLTNSKGSVLLAIPTPVSMRAKPAITNLTVSGVRTTAGSNITPEITSFSVDNFTPLNVNINVATATFNTETYANNTPVFAYVRTAILDANL